VVELPAVPDATGGDGPLAVVLTRWRVDARKRWRDDPEASLVRRITLPRGADFALRGTARLSPRATDDVLAAAIGLDGDGPVTATGSGRMAGVRTAWGRAALDGDPSTAWTSPFGLPVGGSLTVTLRSGDESMDRLVPRVVEDDRHSVPTELTISTATEERVVPLPPGGGPVTFPALTGGTFTFTVTAADVRTTVERRTEEPVDLPVAISELGLGDLTVTPLPTELDTGCRDDLLTIDGVPALVRVTGTVQDALAGAPLALAWCGPAPGPSLTAGTHELRSAAGTATGIDVDQVVLTDGTLPLSPGDAPELRASVLGDGPTSTDVTVDGDGGFWLISGQGHNDGWRASWAGRDLGDPQLVDGGMNGWWVPRSGSETVQVELRWEPQRVVRWGLLAGLVAVGACAALAIRPRRGDAAPRDEPTDEPEAIRRPLAAAPPLSLGPGVTVVAVTALFAWFVIGGWWALTAAVVTGIAAFARHGRRLAGLAAAAIVVGVGVYYVLHQVRVRPLEGFGWVTNVEVMHRPALLAVVLLGADSAIGILAARRDRRYRPLPSRE
jgi:arabinofuranan 3-O-arabinosyltransferase